MSQQLISLSPDLKKLRDEGYEVEIIGGHLVVHHIPYLNSNKELKLGKFIIRLTIQSGIAKYMDHIVYFMGEKPCNIDGSTINSIINSSYKEKINDEIESDYLLSNKPINGYKDHYEQVKRYVDIISLPAIKIYPNISPITFSIYDNESDDGIFNYIDSNESRANIVSLNNKFREQKIAIIGLGGTGSYILDLVSKTPVSEIHLFDADTFYQHNAFRSPGAPSKDEIEKNYYKVEYFSKIYSNMHKGIISYNEYINDTNVNLLNNMSFVFICMDNNDVKQSIIKELMKNNISFFDVGLGINITDNDLLIGTIRLTTGVPSNYSNILEKIPQDNIMDINNNYSTNIQIAELNAFNAILAVIKWKKLSGFYQDMYQECNTLYTINDGELINENQIIRT